MGKIRKDVCLRNSGADVSLHNNGILYYHSDDTRAGPDRIEKHLRKRSITEPAEEKLIKDLPTPAKVLHTIDESEPESVKGAGCHGKVGELSVPVQFIPARTSK